jgi:arylsulfatase A-like enzyme
MIRAFFLTLALAGVVGVGSLACGAETRPNILVVMADDHSTNALSVYGSYRNTTPRMDQLAHEGMRLTQCLVVNSICGPSRAAILSGKYGHLNGFRRNMLRFDTKQTTFPPLIQKAGYQTALVGKWHLSKNDADNAPHGFDYWNILPGQGKYYNPDMFEMGRPVKYEGYTSDVITDKALAFLKRRDKTKPFMLLVHHKAPHSPWEYAGRHEEMYQGQTIPEPPTLWDDYATRSSATANAERSPMASLTQSMLKDNWGTGKLETGGATDAVTLKKLTYQKFLKDYMRSVAGVDDSLGRLVDYIDAQGLTENTLVIYTSDQGFFLGEHGFHNKRFAYEDSIRMPFIAKLPGRIKASTTSQAMVLNIDIAETLLDFADAPIPSDMQGRSIRPVLEQGVTPAGWRTSMFYRYYQGTGVPLHYGVRTERYKLLRFHQTDEWEMYDLHQDPFELDNLYGQPEHAELQGHLKGLMAKLIDQVKITDKDLEGYTPEATPK